MRTVNLTDKFSLINEHWSPRIAGEVNETHIKLVKAKGEFVWHSHEFEDEMFLVVKGQFDMHFRDRIETVREGEFIIVPRGVEHKPVAEEEVHVMLIEPKSTVNTGDAIDPRTVAEPERI